MSQGIDFFIHAEKLNPTIYSGIFYCGVFLVLLLLWCFVFFLYRSCRKIENKFENYFVVIQVVIVCIEFYLQIYFAD